MVYFPSIPIYRDCQSVRPIPGIKKNNQNTTT